MSWGVSPTGSQTPTQASAGGWGVASTPTHPLIQNPEVVAAMQTFAPNLLKGTVSSYGEQHAIRAE
jgi:hypothetical protein